MGTSVSTCLVRGFVHPLARPWHLSSPCYLVIVIAGCSFGCTGEQVGACLGTLMHVIHPTFSHADFILFFLLCTNRRRRQLNTLQPSSRSRYTLSMWPQHSDSIWAVMLTVRSSALIIRYVTCNFRPNILPFSLKFRAGLITAPSVQAIFKDTSK